MISSADFEANSPAFQQYMEEIDRRLQDGNVPIHARPLEAFRLIAMDGMPMIISGIWRDPRTERVDQWFQQRYGKRLLTDFSTGKLVVLIRQAPYEVRYPLILGRVRVNVLEWIQEATPDLLRSLGKDELSELGSLIQTHYGSWMAIENLSLDCRADINAAVMHIMQQQPQYGLSKWASLQSVEKTLKAYIRSKGIKPAHSHKLIDLAGRAERMGLPAVSRPWIEQVQCPAGVRYGEVEVGLEEAVAAHHANLEICRHVAEGMPPGSPE